MRTEFDVSAIEEATAQGRPLYRFEAQLDFVPIGLVPEGLRMANSYEGRVTEGAFPGARVWGIDHLLVRRDGVSVIDSQKTISLADGGGHLYEEVRGYCLPPEGLEVPPLEAMLSPDFTWPEVPFAVQGSSTFRSAVPGFEHLNRAIARIDGWVSFVTGALAVETTLMPHRDVVQPPGELALAGHAG